MSRCRVARLDELPAGEVKLVDAGGTRVVLTRVHDEVYACHDECVHQGGPLSEGKLSGNRLTCPWHGWMYDVKSGECVMPARGGRVASYPVTIEAGDVRQRDTWRIAELLADFFACRSRPLFAPGLVLRRLVRRLALPLRVQVDFPSALR